MEIELERTFLLKDLPKDIKNYKLVQKLDINPETIYNRQVSTLQLNK